MRTPAFFISELADRLAEAARDFVRPYLSAKSRTLARSLQVRQLPSGGSVRRVSVYLPHYWAVYVNDGRNAPFGPRGAEVLVFFRDPRNDPRHRGNYPVRGSQVRRLSRQQFQFWMAENKIAKALGLEPPMVVTKMVNKPTQPTAFFENTGGMAGFDRIAGDIAKREFGAFVREYLGDSFDRRDEIKIRI